MMRTLAAVVLFLFAGVAHAAIIVFGASLDGASENPSVPTAGTGFATVTYDSISHLLGVNVTFANLTGTTTVAHIHCCVDPPGNIGVATFPTTFPGFPAGVMGGSYSGSWNLTDVASYTGGPTGFLTTFGGGTAAGAEAALVQGMLDGRAYVNIHSSFRPGGEIRGFLAVPEPGTLALLGIGFVLVALVLRRRRIR